MEHKSSNDQEKNNPLLSQSLNTQDILQQLRIAELLSKTHLETGDPAIEEDEEEKKVLRHAAEIIAGNSRENAIKQLVEEGIFDIFIEKLTSDEDIRKLINKQAKLIFETKDLKTFAIKIYPKTQAQLLNSFDIEEILPEEFQEAVFGVLQQRYEGFTKSMYHRFKSKNFLKLLKDEYTEQLIKEGNEGIQNCLDQLEGRDSKVIFKFVLDLLLKSKEIIPKTFPKYFFETVEKELREKQQRKFASETKGTKEINTEKSDFSALELTDQKLLEIPAEKSENQLEAEKKIKDIIEHFNLSNSEKKEIQNRLSRLYKNKKPLKLADYFGEENLIIKPEDEGKFLRLVDELGIQTQGERENSKNKGQDPKEEPETKEIKNLTIQHKETTSTQKEQGIGLQNLDTPEEVADYILQELEKHGYLFLNKERFRKEILDFGAQKLNKDLLVFSSSVFDNPDKKSKEIFTIKVGGSARIFLIKQDETFTVDKFCKNHDEYSKYFSFLRKSYD